MLSETDMPLFGCLLIYHGCKMSFAQGQRKDPKEAVAPTPRSRNLTQIAVTGLPAYSDSDGSGTAEKCHCKRVSLYLMIFSIRISFFGPTKCHCSQIVTLTGVTVNGEACTRCPTPMLNLNKNETNQSGN